MPQMTSLDVRDQIKSLEKKALELKAAEVKGVVTRIKQAIDYYELTPQHLFSPLVLKKLGSAPAPAPMPSAGAPEATTAARKTTKGQKVAPKFKDQNGNTWSGRGTMPRWLAAEVAAGKAVQDFAV